VMDQGLYVGRLTSGKYFISETMYICLEAAVSRAESHAYLAAQIAMHCVICNVCTFTVISIHFSALTLLVTSGWITERAFVLQQSPTVVVCETWTSWKNKFMPLLHLSLAVCECVLYSCIS